MVEAVFWFHPLVWFLGTRLLDERERACDEEVLRTGKQPYAYAEGVLRVCELYLQSPLRCMSGVTKSNLKARIQAIVAGHIGCDLSVSKKTGLAAAGILALAMPIAIGILHAAPVQTARPKFEIVSIKPTGDRGGGTMRPMPGRLTASAPLGVLMEAAYQAQSFQIIGGPAWIESDGYAVDAKAAGNPEHEQMMLMLQSLLEDRFQLKVHRESREMPLYALVPARGGLKLRPPRDGSCVEETDVLGPLADPGARLQPPGQDRSPAPKCGGLDVPLEVGGARLLGGKVPMAEFVRVLSRVL